MQRRLRYYGDPVLRKKAEPLKDFDPVFLKQLVEEMDLIMKDNDGMGLAGPQIGESLRIFIFRAPFEAEPGKWELGPLEVFINPTLSNPTDQMWLLEEGCLSLPKIKVTVERPVGITIEAYDIEGKPFKLSAEGIIARAWMHENDHLNGVLIIDRASKKERAQAEPHLRAIKNTHKQK